MSQISIIKASSIREAKRFDSEYFKPEYLKFEKKLESKNIEFLRNLSEKPRYGTTPSNGIFEKEGVPFIRSQDFKDSFVNLESINFCKKEFHKKNKKSNIKFGDILIASVGASIGEIGIYLEDVEANINQNVSRIRARISPFYLFAFLSSSFGYSQLMRLNTGNAQAFLNSLQIEKIKVPIFSNSFQLKIEKIIKDAKEKQEESKEKYKNAEKILFKELSLADIKPTHRLTYTTTIRKINESKRFDSEHFQPKYEVIEKKIEDYKGEFCRVGDLISWKKGIEVGSGEYLENGFDFGRVGDFSKFGFKYTSKKISEKKFLELQKEFQPKIGEILFTKDGTIGISHLLKKNFNGILGSAFLRLTFKKDFDAETLTLILNSILIGLQVEKFSGGAIIKHLKPSDFEKIKIPLIKKNIQQKIAKNIQESHSLRKESEELLNLAKKKIEREIEK